MHLGSLHPDDTIIGAIPVPFVILAGQSNAVGKASASSLTDQGYVAAYSACQLYRKVAVGALTDPPTWTVDEGPVALQPRTGSSQNMGPELSLGRAIDRPLVQFGVSGIGLAGGWIDPAYPTGQDQFNTQFIDYVDSKPGTPGCIVWIQGETDAGVSADANAYEANLTSVIATWRAQWGETLPIVIVRVSANATLSFKTAVRTAQSNVWSANKSTMMLIDTDDLPMLDTLHYTADGYITLGTRCGDAANQLMGAANVAPVASFSADVVGLGVTFTDASYDSGDTIASWSWDFGDGSTSTAQNPSHTYSTSGTYTATLTVTDSHGSTTETSQDVTVNGISWTVDATLGWGLPADATELAAAIAQTTFPTGRTYNANDFIIYNCQETGAAGHTTLIDSGANGHNATAFGNSLAYQQTLAGASRKFVRTFDAVAHGWQCTDAGLPDISTAGFTIALLVAQVASTTTNASRAVASIGTTSTCWVGGAANTRVASGVNSSASVTTDYGQIQAYTLGNGLSTGEKTVGTDKANKVTPTPSVAITGKALTLGKSTTACSTAWIGYVLAYKGDMPPADRKALHLTLSVPATWS